MVTVQLFHPLLPSGAVQIAKSLGATVFGTAGTPEGMAVVTKCGADGVFNHREEGYETKMVEALEAKEGEKGFDLILENLANVNLDRDTGMIKTGGCRTVPMSYDAFFLRARGIAS